MDIDDVNARVTTHEKICSERYQGIDAQLKAMAKTLDAQTGMLEAWTTAKTGGNFVIWLGKLLVGIGVIVIAVKTGFAGLK